MELKRGFEPATTYGYTLVMRRSCVVPSLHNCPGRVRRVKAKPLRGRFASPDTTPTAQGMAAIEGTGEEQGTACLQTGTGPERRALFGLAPPASTVLRIPLRGTRLRRAVDPADLCQPSGPDSEGQAKGQARSARGEPHRPGC